jgi:two-component system cell cycle response regulator
MKPNKQALNALLVHRAIHAYVSNTQRIEISRLQRQSLLYPEYFSSELMSATAISRSISDLLNTERSNHGLEPIYFKLASKNPTNPINQADPLEAELLVKMNRDGLKRFEDVIDLMGQKYLYLALPIDRSNDGCLRCHGDPKDAPGEMVVEYGDKAGFFEAPNDIRALISIRAPMATIFAKANEVADTLTLAVFFVLSGIFALIAVFSLRIDRQQHQIVQQNLDLSRLSVTDTLTGATNRLGLTDRLKELLSASRRFAQPLSVMMLDLDHFKRINDAHGHPCGDAVLVQFVAVVKQIIRASDLLGRWGGEEFLLVAPHLDLTGSKRLADKVRLSVEAAHFDKNIHLTVSIGVAEWAPGQSLEALIEQADKALYQAKASGRNQVVGSAAGDLQQQPNPFH